MLVLFKIIRAFLCMNYETLTINSIKKGENNMSNIVVKIEKSGNRYILGMPMVINSRPKLPQVLVEEHMKWYGS